MSFLTKYLGLGTEANDAAGEAVERVETVTEFLGDVAEKLPDLIERAEDAADASPIYSMTQSRRRRPGSPSWARRCRLLRRSSASLSS